MGMNEVTLVRIYLRRKKRNEGLKGGVWVERGSKVVRDFFVIQDGCI